MDVVRLLTPDDADAFVALRREALLDTPHAFAASPEMDRASDAPRVRASLSEPENVIVGGWDGAKVIASAGVHRQPMPKSRHLAVIWGVYVTPAARGRGLGRAVVARAIEAARSWDGLGGIRLSVSEATPIAQRVYESLGFQAWGREPDALRIGDRSYAEVHMFMHLA